MYAPLASEFDIKNTASSSSSSGRVSNADLMQFVKGVLPDEIVDKEKERIYASKLARRRLTMDNANLAKNTKKSTHNESKKHEVSGRLRKKQKSHRLTGKQGAFAVRQRTDRAKEKMSYLSYLPLHNLWCDYIRDVLPPQIFLPPGPVPNPKLTASAELALTKADLHGAMVSVEVSKSPSLIGQSGILLQESYHTFSVLTAKNKLIVIPKKNSIFIISIHGVQNGQLIVHPSTSFRIYGNHFCVRPSERSTRKFKSRATIEL